MPILNYTTEIDVHKTIGEIQRVLAKAGATAVIVDYNGQGEPQALMFLIKFHDEAVSFRLPSRWEGVLRRLHNDPKVPRGFRTETQARRVAWRIMKDWVEAQMAIIEAGQAELVEVFLPYAVTNSGQSLYQVFNSSQKLLSAGE
jgi:hypothetical protein